MIKSGSSDSCSGSNLVGGAKGEGSYILKRGRSTKRWYQSSRREVMGPELKIWQ